MIFLSINMMQASPDLHKPSYINVDLRKKYIRYIELVEALKAIYTCKCTLYHFI